MARWGKSDYVAAWRAEADRLREAVLADGLDRDVPSCPGWSAGELLGHVAQVYLNIARRLVTQEPPPDDSRGLADFTVTGEVVAAYDKAAEQLAATLDGVGVDDPSWNPAPLPKTAWFWIRRVTCETAVHRWDAQMAAAATEPIDGTLAASGIDEVFDAFVPMGRRREETETTGVVQLFATDLDRHWFVRLRQGRLSLLDPHSVDLDNAEVQATASGPASDLYLALWGRLQTGVLDLTGDGDLFKSLRVR